ncbi:Hsp70 family protein [Plantactinospora soyae]|uniref:Outer membrane protein assembly factor BamB n=1 Tax=Plantactinospora soyae TaxID=1544732 RepID=A0A927R8J1_9ACTN|nr:hsp70 family protein [Plantactinospora soyae]MBE1490484.1 outer membrane protein assembly factor BamB [Plantactinospora soyae]
MDQPVRLAIDLGTTHTIAVVRRDDHQPPRTLLFDGSPLLSSAGYVAPDGTVHTGRDAERLGATDPQRYEPHPKRRIDDGTLLLGTDEVPVERLLTATLRRVADEARTAGVDPAAATVLTYPADWGPPRRNLLRSAAQNAGLGPVRLLDEPVAAATYCVDILHQQLPTGGSLGIFDFGGGTLDVTVVRRDPDGLRVLATGGLDDLGGLDIDEALVAHLGHLIELRDPALWHRLNQPDTPAHRRDRQAFWTEVRTAKEMLSRTTSAPVQVPGRDDPVHLTRDELDRVAGPLIARAVDETRRVLQRAAVDPAHLTGLLLVGGSSRLPLVASRLHARLGIAPSVPEQPELPVAYGAIRRTTPPTPHPGPPRPGYQPAAYPPMAGPTWSPNPPTPPPAIPTRPHTATQQPPGPTARTTRRRPIRRLLIVSTAFIAVAGCIGTAVVGGNWLKNTIAAVGTLNNTGNGIGTNLGAPDPAGDLKQVNGYPSTRTGAAAVTVAGDHVISAVSGDGATEVVSLPGNDAPPRWTATVPMEPSELRIAAVGDLIILDGLRSITNYGDDVRAVLSATNGKLLWKRAWANRTDVAYYGTDVVVEIRSGTDKHSIARVDLRTGKQEWSRTGPRDVLSTDDHRTEPMRQWPTPPSTPAATLPAVNGVLTDAVVAATPIIELDAKNGRGTLLDAKTGKAQGSGKLPLDDGIWVAYDNLVIGKTATRSAGAQQVLAGHAVPGFQQRWTVPLAAVERIERVKPCGPHLVCVAITGPDANHTLAVDTRTGTPAWRIAVDNSDEDWYAHGDTILAGKSTFFESLDDPRLVNQSDGKARRKLSEYSTVLATNGGRMVLSSTDGLPIKWQLHVEETATDRSTSTVAVGDKSPEQVAVAGDLVGVITGDRRTLALRISGMN